jgi:hypothetical protein
MKKTIAVISVLALASFTCAHAARPDGTLGVDSVGVRGIYINASSDSSSSDLDFNGIGLGINKNLFSNDSIGVDAGFDFGFVTNQNKKDIYGMDDCGYTLSATVYRTGMISPYFKAGITYETVDFDYTAEAGASDWSDDTVILGGEVGFECHLMPGFSVTPAISYGYDTRADNDAGQVDFSLTANYWFTERAGMQISGIYNTQNDNDFFEATLGFNFHF